MPLHIIRKDITKVVCDAIVSPTNHNLSPDGGVALAIEKIGGEQYIKACAHLKELQVAETAVTPAFNLPSAYVIHTVGPRWRGGVNNERAVLFNTYLNCLNTAAKQGFNSVAIPLISSGAYGFPKDIVLKIAVNAISEFLFKNELNVFLVVYDKSSYQFSKDLYGEISEYISDNFFDDKLLFSSALLSIDSEEPQPKEEDKKQERAKPFVSKSISGNSARVVEKQARLKFKVNDIYEDRAPRRYNTIEAMLGQIDDTFVVALLKLIDLKGISDLQCYKRANVSKQTWYKILNEKNYRPSKNTIIAFAISLELNFEQTQHLLSTAGFTLSKSNKFDIIIEYFIKKGVYDIMVINEALFEFDQPCLGV